MIDPMSSFLFSIGVIHSVRHMQQLRKLRDFNFHPRCEILGITHLMFADELLIFTRADEVSVHMIYKAFLQFSQASGLK